MEPRILLVDDEPHIRSAILELFLSKGWSCIEAEHGHQAQKILETQPIDLVLSDIRMPVMDGLTLLDWTLSSGPGVPVILMTAHGDVSQAVQALQRGAADYITKPFDFDELLERVQRILTKKVSWAEPTLPIDSLAPTMKGSAHIQHGQWFLPHKGAMGDILNLAQRSAPTDSTVLLTGESGTGKEVVARFIHNQSTRNEGPFIPVNLGAIPETLIESELFGHEKGSFSGAHGRKIGFFEAAQRGTLFLDEIGELPLHLQVKLLRVLQERTIVRVGSTSQVPLDVRIIAASNRNLEALVKEGRFRQDLFYRIQVMHLSLPSLKHRREDIPDLTHILLTRLASRMAVQGIPHISQAALDLLMTYDFPGNVRELENILERALILADVQAGFRIIEPKNLGILPLSSCIDEDAEPTESTLSQVNHGVDFPTEDSLVAWETYAIQRALRKTDQNRTKAAQILGIGRRTLQEKIKTYNLDT